MLRLFYMIKKSPILILVIVFMVMGFIVGYIDNGPKLKTAEAVFKK